jgi:hypothetical protein
MHTSSALERSLLARIPPAAPAVTTLRAERRRRPAARPARSRPPVRHGTPAPRTTTCPGPGDPRSSPSRHRRQACTAAAGTSTSSTTLGAAPLPQPRPIHNLKHR